MLRDPQKPQKTGGDYWDIWQRTVTVISSEPEQKPLLYTADGMPLMRKRDEFGFQPPKKESR